VKREIRREKKIKENKIKDPREGGKTKKNKAK